MELLKGVRGFPWDPNEKADNTGISDTMGAEVPVVLPAPLARGAEGIISSDSDDSSSDSASDEPAGHAGSRKGMGAGEGMATAANDNVQATQAPVPEGNDDAELARSGAPETPRGRQPMAAEGGQPKGLSGG